MTTIEPIPERLRLHAAHRGNAVAFRIASRGGVVEITWAELWAQANAVAALFDGKEGRIAIACEDTLDFIVAMAACFKSGNAAVPAPVALSRRSAPRTSAILQAAEPTILVAGSTVPDWLEEIAAAHGCDVVTFDRHKLANGPTEETTPNPSTLALIQFSSGSTGYPKGVGLTHANIAANCRAIATAYGLSQETRGLSWLPLHHDMGLIGHVLTPFWLGCRSTLMDPLRFLQRPLDWLRMVEQEQATITSAPNFAYEICARAAETDKEPLDLASLTAAVCGGEPVLPSTVRRFIAAFAPAGFRPSAFAPSYGLAEATLLVASGRTETGPRFVEAPVESNKPILEVADLGAPVSGVACRIVDESGSEVAEGTVGEIEVTGESVGLILGELPGLPLNTGDLGFFREGRLCVAGRKKELIILRGQNIYPSDVEAAALEAHPAIAPGGVAAVGIGADGTQKLVVAVELDRKASPSVEELARLRRLVGEQVSRRVGFVPENVVVCRFGTLPRTTSGKIQRGETALRLSAGTLADLAPTPPMEHTTEKV